MQLRTRRRTLITNRVETLNLVEMCNWYLEHFAPEQKAHTRKAKVQDLEWLLVFAALESRCSSTELQVGDLSPALLHGFREHRISQGEAVSTVNRRMATIKHFCRKVKERVPTWINPSEGIKDIPTEENEFRGISKAEAESIIEAAYTLGSSLFFHHRSGLICLIALGCGLRAMEIANLRIGQLSDDRKWFRGVVCKGGKVRNVPIRSDVRESIIEWLPVRERALCEHLASYNRVSLSKKSQIPLLPTISRANAENPSACVMDYKTIHRTFAKACQVADREHINPHRFRHAFCRQLLDATNDITLVSQAVGHSNIQTTMQYLKRREEEIAEKVESVVTARGAK